MDIKICGITDINEIKFLNDLKPDYIGFVFAESKRKLTKAKGKLFYYSVSEDIQIVGVFRNNTKEFIEDILKEIPLNAIQLHGNEDEEFIKFFKDNYKVEVWKGISIESKEDFNKAIKLPVDTLILDGKNPGSGKTFDWGNIGDIPKEIKVFIAGGINEDNVLEAMKYKNIQGIDLSSSVESIIDGKSIKDKKKVERLIRKVRENNER
ncbi:MAG: phosphoribosylanthranilate isomerase [Clostridium sp.]|nr:phosphoribosylanthranilate isomerase [Clostridium sp.]